MSTISDKYEFYWKGPFSQWHHSEFELDGVHFATAEQAMMYFKAILFKDSETAREILGSTDPGKQKALGRQVRSFREDVWDANKIGIVRRISLTKFGQNKGLRRKLFQTMGKTLVEASPMDTVWGIGLNATDAATMEPSDWPGQNLLGEILTDTRAELAKAHKDEARACAGEPMGEKI